MIARDAMQGIGNDLRSVVFDGHAGGTTVNQLYEAIRGAAPLAGDKGQRCGPLVVGQECEEDRRGLGIKRCNVMMIIMILVF